MESEGAQRDWDTLAEQIAYYRARAPRYDEWWFRTGGHTLPPDRKIEWDAEVARLEAAVDDLQPGGKVLELACGTGLWTARLLRHAEQLVAVDSSPEMIELNRARTQGSHVEYLQADLFSWQPPQGFDLVFFSFWLSHVPPGYFASFWDLVRLSLAPGGRALFIDNLWGDETAPGGVRPTTFEQYRSDSGDGRDYRVVKIFYEPDELARELADVGWNADIKTTGRSFLVGCATPFDFDRSRV
jgi:demethylmenaquinone methyltransferase/2-methoxy-6-polyprenyl-1,4-benzoquinol methylase